MYLKYFIFSIMLCSNCLDVMSREQSTEQESDTLSLVWFKELGSKGLDIAGDSIFISKEFQKTLKDSSYRASIYPEQYDWPKATMLLKELELKKAFWHMINLYPKNEVNKELVIRTMLAYDKLLSMDEVLVNTFYTYCFMDPQISEIINDVPEIKRPDILEAKLRDTREIVAYIYSYRIQHSEQLDIPPNN